MTSRWIIWTVIILMGCLPHHVMAQDSQNIEVNLDVIKRFEKPVTAKPKLSPAQSQQHTKPDPAQARADQTKKPQSGLIPPPSRKLISAYPDGTLKTKAVLEYEQSLRALRAKYFPVEAQQTSPETRAPDIKPKTPQSAQKPRSSRKPTTIAPAPRKIEPIPAPLYPPPRQSNVVDVIEEKIAAPAHKKTKQVTPKESAKIVPQTTSGNTSDARAPKPSEIKGLKIVSIAYMDEEVALNNNVQSALISTYIPRLKAQKSYRIGLYSYSSIINRSEKQARAISLERAIALKDFLIAQGIDKKRIDIFPAGKSDVASFSDWIDIILQK